jgi:hypothetical protein
MSEPKELREPSQTSLSRRSLLRGLLATTAGVVVGRAAAPFVGIDLAKPGSNATAIYDMMLGEYQGVTLKMIDTISRGGVAASVSGVDPWRGYWISYISSDVWRDLEGEQP